MTERIPADSPFQPAAAAPFWCLPAVVFAAVVGLSLMRETAWSISATYDEVAYLRVAANWWRTGRQTEITRMGSPLTFWKLQQAPTLWRLDHSRRRQLVDEPLARQSDLLPYVRTGALWVWLAALGITAAWARRLHGPKAMAFAAWLFALSPNLLAHGSIVTMEMPLVAGAAGTFYLFWRFLRGGRRRGFWASAALAGLTFSCKFTAALIPPLLGLVWWLDLWKGRGQGPVQAAMNAARGMTAFTALMLFSDWAVTDFAVLPLSQTAGGGHPSVDARFPGRPWLGKLLHAALETSVPQDLVGFATQIHHQRSGGPSYLLGETRMTGWWYYYFVALAVKVPLSFWLLTSLRAGLARRVPRPARDPMIPTIIAAFLVVTAVGSSRNYGIRYLLPLAPLAVVWVSALAELPGWPRRVAWLALLGQGAAVASVHPNELTYFNELAGGPVGGHRVLADSNLDWGQGLKSLRTLQIDHAEFRDLTLYYFGDTDPVYYHVPGVCHVVDAVNPWKNLPPRFEASTDYVAVSASLLWGPWAPPGYFERLSRARPLRLTDDATIAIFRTADLPPPAGKSAPSRHAPPSQSL